MITILIIRFSILFRNMGVFRAVEINKNKEKKTMTNTNKEEEHSEEGEDNTTHITG